MGIIQAQETPRLPTGPDACPEEVRAEVKRAAPYLKKAGLPAKLVLTFQGVRYEVELVEEEYANSRRKYWQAKVRASASESSRFEIPL